MSEDARLSHLFVHVRDGDAARRFYGELLGVYFSADDAGYLRVADADDQDSFHLGMEAVPDLDGADEPELVFSVRDVDATYERLSAAGIAFDGPPEDMPWGRRQAWLRDPNGVRLSIYTRAGDAS